MFKSEEIRIIESLDIAGDELSHFSVNSALELKENSMALRYLCYRNTRFGATSIGRSEVEHIVREVTYFKEYWNSESSDFLSGLHFLADSTYLEDIGDVLIRVSWDKDALYLNEHKKRTYSKLLVYVPNENRAYYVLEGYLKDSFDCENIKRLRDISKTLVF